MGSQLALTLTVPNATAEEMVRRTNFEQRDALQVAAESAARAPKAEKAPGAKVAYHVSLSGSEQGDDLVEGARSRSSADAAGGSGANAALAAGASSSTGPLPVGRIARTAGERAALDRELQA